MKKICFILLSFLLIFLASCEFPIEVTPGEHVDPKTCEHEFIERRTEPTCTEEGKVTFFCAKCGEVVTERTINALGHDLRFAISEKSVDGSIGTKGNVCSRCGETFDSYNYVDIGYSRFGKLKVEGRDLVDQDGNPVKLVGISTHGLQWFSKYVNYDTLYYCKEAFNINVFRFSLYTSENGYCETNATNKEKLYQTVLNGVKICAELDMYAIVDWHMLGAGNTKDENPLYYLDEAKEFFDRITQDLADYDNDLYEIMNEPNGSTTWADCKAYANEVIPIIRENKPSAIVLVGNPKWSSDLASPTNDPLDYDNLMYTFHFYAADNMSTRKVINAYNSNLPIFVSEHGGMDSSGDGAVNYNNINEWYRILDSRNISYVAWNLSNSNGSSSILKAGSTAMTDFSDDNLKAWGIYYKAHIRTILGLDE